MKKIHFKIKLHTFTHKKNANWVSIFLSKKKSISKLFNEQIANNLAAWLLDSANIKKSFDWWICLTIPAGNANLLPPVGPFLGQHGFNTMNFCNTFNTLTKIFPENTPIKTYIKLFTDKTLLFQLWTPPTAYLLYSSNLENNNNGVTLKNLLKIILIKKIDHPETNLISILSNILGTLSSTKISLSK